MTESDRSYLFVTKPQIVHTNQYDKTRSITRVGQILRHFFINPKVCQIGIWSLGFLAVLFEI